MQYLADKQPQPSELVEIANGVMWLTMPLPFELDHINLYLIKDGDNWVVVDTGIGTSTTKALWQQIFEKLNGNISAVIVTHLHPDHIGLAGWIADEFDVPFYMSQTEYFTARAFCAGKNGASNKRDARYFSQAGLDSDLVEKLTQGDGKGFSQVVSPIPVSYTRLRHNDVLSFDNNEWKYADYNFHFTNDAAINQIIQRLFFLFSEDHPSKDVFVDFMLKELMIRIIRANYKEIYTEQALQLSGNNRIAFVINYIRKNLDKPLSIRELSNKAYMSESHFHRVFKNELGISPVDFINNERIKLATRLLADPKITVKQEYMRCGFDSRSYFNRMFRKKQQLSPTQYQAKYAQEVA